MSRVDWDARKRAAHRWFGAFPTETFAGERLGWRFWIGPVLVWSGNDRRLPHVSWTGGAS